MLVRKPTMNSLGFIGIFQKAHFHLMWMKFLKLSGSLLIADEVQSGFGRTGDFFAFQKHKIKPDIVTIAKGMGNGFPVGGVLVSDKIKEEYGLLGSTFGGNHLACSSSLAVLNVIKQERLMKNAKNMEKYFRKSVSKINNVKVKRRRKM